MISPDSAAPSATAEASVLGYGQGSDVSLVPVAVIERPLPEVAAFFEDPANDPLWRGELPFPIRTAPAGDTLDDTTRRVRFSTRSDGAVTEAEYLCEAIGVVTRVTATLRVTRDPLRPRVRTTRVRDRLSDEAGTLTVAREVLEDGKASLPASFRSVVPPRGSWRAHPVFQVAMALIVSLNTGLLLWPRYQEANLAEDGGPRFAAALSFLGALAIIALVVAFAAGLAGNGGHLAALVAALEAGEILGPILRHLPHSEIVSAGDHSTRLDPAGQWVVVAAVFAVVLPFVLVNLPGRSSKTQYLLFALGMIPALVFLAIFQPWTL